MGKIKQKYEENKLRAWATFGYLIFSISCLRVGFRYGIEDTEGVLPKGLDWLSTPSGSIIFWAILWGLASVLGVVAATKSFFSVENAANKLIFGSVCVFFALHLIWGGSYATGWLLFNADTEWFNTLGYAGYLGMLTGYGAGSLGAIRGKKPFTKINKD